LIEGFFRPEFWVPQTVRMLSSTLSRVPKTQGILERSFLSITRMPFSGDILFDAVAAKPRELLPVMMASYAGLGSLPVPPVSKNCRREGNRCFMLLSRYRGLKKREASRP